MTRSRSVYVDICIFVYYAKLYSTKQSPCIVFLIHISVFGIDPLPRPCDVVRQAPDHVVILDGLLDHLPPLSPHCYHRFKGVENLNLKNDISISSLIECKKDAIHLHCESHG